MNLSYHSNTCNNKNDAKEKGSRHIATFYAKKNGMCHFINKKESGDIFSKKKIYNYCCYDNAMTRVLVEQAKAQLAKNWSSCTDITIKELGKLKLNDCSQTDRDNGVDGVEMSYLASTEERMGAYQYKEHCIDTKEYVDKMMEMFGGNNMLIDKNAIQETLDVLKE